MLFEQKDNLKKVYPQIYQKTRLKILFLFVYNLFKKIYFINQIIQIQPYSSKDYIRTPNPKTIKIIILIIIKRLNIKILKHF